TNTHLGLTDLSSSVTQQPSPRLSIRRLHATAQWFSFSLDAWLEFPFLLQVYSTVLIRKLCIFYISDAATGKTALIKALLNLKNGRNDTILELLQIAKQTGDLETLINAAFTAPRYKGQTALHVAIERRHLTYVELLVKMGADPQAKANGTFFQWGEKCGFYFGELPLSLAACTNQPKMVSFLMDNNHRKADPTDKDSQGNTVLHALVVIADDTTENVEMVANMYDQILLQYYKSNKVNLESFENNEGLTPLKLAAKLGKIGLLRHMLSREVMDKETRVLSRKFTRWIYGPVGSSLYDISSIDTDQNKSVLEMIIFESDNPNRPEMLQIEPLKSLLQHKWTKFAWKLFLMNFLSYVTYLAIFTSVALSTKDKQVTQGFGTLIKVYLLLTKSSMTHFHRNPPKMRTLFINGFSDILFFLQAVGVLLSTVLSFCGCREYVKILVLSLVVAWVSILYYAIGIKQLGIYNVMMQRIILGDLLHFLCIYSALLFGFSSGKCLPTIQNVFPDHIPFSLTQLFTPTAIVAISRDPSGTVKTNETLAPESNLKADAGCKMENYEDFRTTMIELFKFTIGMGDLEFTNTFEYIEVFYILLICYIVLTYILMLNMLIALMGNTVERISEQSETIWSLQVTSFSECRIFKGARNLCVSVGWGLNPFFFDFRVNEINWTKWRTYLCLKLEEDPGNAK
uniref:Ion transport domain-containing protein n=1 Tax=Cyprinodon variegatus TaxID=28743 RepID=A0A3Q2EE60_CYPVA